MSDANLCLVDTESLLDEIGKRFDALIFAGSKFGIKGNRSEFIAMSYRGNELYCLGLAMDLVHDILHGKNKRPRKRRHKS